MLLLVDDLAAEIHKNCVGTSYDTALFGYPAYNTQTKIHINDAIDGVNRKNSALFKSITIAESVDRQLPGECFL